MRQRAQAPVRYRKLCEFNSLAVIILAACLGACVSPNGISEDVTFTGAGGTQLRGTLIKPRQESEALPAIVLLHGAEKATRDRMIYTLTANVFLDYGIAVFVYDKRGAGESGGDYETTTYAQLVEDAISAVSVVKGNPSIDAQRVGILGISESGWLTPEIAERSGATFVINKVGSALSVQDTIAWEIYNELLDDGVSESRANEQVDIYRRIWKFRVAPTNDERSALEGILADWSDLQDSHLPKVLRDVSDDYIADISYDPGPYLERLKAPTLFLYGTEDVNIPSAECVVRLDVLSAQGLPVSYHIFEDEGHELGGFSPLPPFYAFADDYARLIREFALLHTR